MSKRYTPEQIKQLLDLNSQRLLSGLISTEEFDAQKLEIMRLPRKLITYERHNVEGNCEFCQEEFASMDNSLLVHQGSNAKSEKVRGISI